MTANFGMMEGAYFVGRGELLAWLNNTFQLPYTKIEETCSGAAACQIMDAIHPGKVPLSKVDFNAKHDYEYVKNYKILQAVFNKVGIDKIIPVDKLILGRYQDNLEFLQWLKRYYDLNYRPETNYDALARRIECKCDYKGDRGKLPGKQSTDNTKNATESVSNNINSTNENSTTTTAHDTKSSRTSTAVVTPKKVPSSSSIVKSQAADDRRYSVASSNTRTLATRTNRQSTAPSFKVPPSKAKSSNTDSKVQELTVQIAELKLKVDNLEKERDFYFNKLREIEIWTQTVGPSLQSVAAEIQRILYSTGTEPMQQTAEAQGEPSQNDRATSMRSEVPPSAHSEVPPSAHSEVPPSAHSEVPPSAHSEVPPSTHSEVPSSDTTPTSTLTPTTVPTMATVTAATGTTDAK
jgi:RP/EB family microtubule-associated protein